MHELITDGSLLRLTRFDRETAGEYKVKEDWDLEAEECSDPFAISLKCRLVAHIATLIHITIQLGEGTEFALRTETIDCCDNDRGKKEARKAAIANTSNNSWYEIKSSKDSQNSIDSKEKQCATI